MIFIAQFLCNISYCLVNAVFLYKGYPQHQSNLCIEFTQKKFFLFSLLLLFLGIAFNGNFCLQKMSKSTENLFLMIYILV